LNYLTRAEEYILLAVWRLQGNAYTLPIQKRLSEITGRKWSLSSIYAPLERLEKKYMIASSLSDARPERGGRPKRIYLLTPTGKKALLDIQQIGLSMWDGVSGLSLSEVKK